MDTRRMCSRYHVLFQEMLPIRVKTHLARFRRGSEFHFARYHDARSGEAEFQYADGQNSYLSELASMPTFTSKQPDPAPPSTPPTADQKTRKPKGHIGEPSPYRDQVGTVQQEGEATHCSFSGPIKLEAARWLESKVQEVQCSTCGSVSKAKLKEQSVVISPHPPRKSRPVRNVTRWMEQESDWVLVQKKE
jgi:hypothetical protein